MKHENEKWIHFLCGRSLLPSPRARYSKTNYHQILVYVKVPLTTQCFHAMVFPLCLLRMSGWLCDMLKLFFELQCMLTLCASSLTSTLGYPIPFNTWSSHTLFATHLCHSLLHCLRYLAFYARRNLCHIVTSQSP